MTRSYYALTRHTVVDSAGTPLEETLFTSDRGRLELAIRTSIDRPSGFVEDNLRVAWEHSLQRSENALSQHLAPWLEIHDRSPLRRQLVADTTVARGGQSLTLRVDHKGLSASRRRGGRRSPFQLGELTYASLEAVGEGPQLAPLQRAAGPVEVSFNFTGLFESIPGLVDPPLEAPLRFLPFFESEAFRELWEDEAAEVDLGPCRGDAWEGLLPLDVWLSLEPLQTLCHDADVEPSMVPS